GLGVRSDEDEEPAGIETRYLPGVRVPDVDPLDRRIAVGRDDVRTRQYADVRARPELVDEVHRHALLEPIAAAENRDPARVRGEEHRHLPGGVAGPHDVDVEAVDVRRLGPRRAV